MILVCGGAGYIGSHVAKSLRRKGFDVLVLDSLENGYNELVKWGNLIVGQIGDRKLLDQIFVQYNIEAVMHFAAYIEVGQSISDPFSFYQNNFCQTVNLIKSALEHNVNKFIFSSTAAVFGNPDYLPIDEKHKTSPINPYGQSKLAVENAMQDFDRAYGLKYISFRYFNASGADPDLETGERHRPETHLIPLILEVPLGKRKNIKVFGNDYDTKDGTCIRDYIHVMDLADAHVAGVKYLLDGNDSAIFNLGNGSGFTVNEVINMAREITGHEIPAVVSERREGDPPSLVASSEKARATLDWNPRYNDLKTIIQTAWDWCNSQLYKDL